MAVLDINKVSARVNWLLLTQATGGTFNNTVDDERFHVDELKRVCVETESEVFRGLAESYHPLRLDFLNWTTDLDHGDTLPSHFGTVEAIRIKPFAAAAGYKKGREVPSSSEIQDWRDNVENVFGEIAHDQPDSPLACYYYLENQTVYFTGYKLQAKICIYEANFADPALQLDDSLESLIVCGAVSKLLKDGSNSQIAGFYANQYAALINQLRGGMRQRAEIQEMHKI